MRKYTSVIFAATILSLNAWAQNADRMIPKTHTGSITCMAGNFNNSIVVTGGADSRANVWDLAAGVKLRALAAQNDTLTDVVYNNDESLFATSSKNKTIVVWDAQTFKPKKMFATPAVVVGLSFHPFQNNLLTINVNGQVDLWDAIGGKTIKEGLVKIDGAKANRASIKWSADGKAFAVGVGDKLMLYKADGAAIGTIAASPTKQGTVLFDISPDAKMVAVKSGNNQITLANLLTGQTTTQVSEDVASLSTLQFAQNSDHLVLAFDNGDVALLNTTTKKKTTLVSLKTNVIKTSVSIDGNTLVTAGSDLAIKRTDISSQQLGTREIPMQATAGKFVIKRIQLIDENKNGLLDGGEKASMDIALANTGNTPVYNAVLSLSMATANGVEYPTEVTAGNFAEGATRTISVPLKVLASITNGSSSFKVVAKSGKSVLSTDSVSLETGSSSNAGVEIKSFNFYSPSGKITKSEPITLVVNIENVTRIIAEKVQVKFKVPAGIRPIDKTLESIAKIPPGTMVQASMQFIVDNDFKDATINIGMDITGVAYSNASTIAINTTIGKTVSKPGDMMADAAANKDMVMKGKPMTTAVDADALKSIEDGKYIALVIGINEYSGTWSRLNNAVNDAKALEQVLKKQYGFAEVRTLFDKEATRAKIISELEWLVSHVTENDNLVVYYSGHGDFRESLNKGFWVPIDAVSTSTSYLISNSDIQTFLSSIPAKHTLLISDACFSGDIFRSATATPPAEINQKYYNRVYNLKSRQAITSGGLEPVMDGGRDNHSVFAYYLLNVLQDNKLKFFDSAQLFDAIKIPIANNSSQAPKFSPIKNTGDAGGEFVFLKK